MDAENAILNIGDAAVILTAGAVEVIVTGGVAPTEGAAVPLIAGSSITEETDIGTLELTAGLFGTLETVDGLLQVVIGVLPLELTLGAYDALLQTAWYADRAFGRSLLSPQCDPMEHFGRTVCGWMRAGGRFSQHRPSAQAQYDENAYNFVGGASITGNGWRMAVAAAYEDSDLTMRMPDETQSLQKEHASLAGRDSRKP